MKLKVGIKSAQAKYGVGDPRRAGGRNPVAAHCNQRRRSDLVWGDAGRSPGSVMSPRLRFTQGCTSGDKKELFLKATRDARSRRPELGF